MAPADSSGRMRAFISWAEYVSHAAGQLFRHAHARLSAGVRQRALLQARRLYDRHEVLGRPCRSLQGPENEPAAVLAGLRAGKDSAFSFLFQPTPIQHSS